jgi:hypothetical protein
MANDNKNAPGSQGQGQGSGQTGKQNQGQGNDPSRKDASSNSGSRPGDKPQYDADRPGYDVDVETDIPGGRKNASEPDRAGQGKSGMGWGDGGDRPQTDGSSGARPPGQRPDDERQTKKSP